MYQLHTAKQLKYFDEVIRLSVFITTKDTVKTEYRKFYPSDIPLLQDGLLSLQGRKE